MLRVQEDSKPLAVINFRFFKTRLEASEQLKKYLTLMIFIEDSGYCLRIRCKTETEYVRLLAMARVKSRLYTGNFEFRFDVNPNFHKNVYLSERDFLRTSDSCDLLLF